MQKTSYELCITCKYRGSYLSPKKTTGCNYLIMTGKRRDCPVGLCDKYEKDSGER